MKKSFWVMKDVLIVSLAMGCGVSGEQKAEEKKKPIATVETFVLEKDRFNTELNLPGELISFQQVDLYARETSFVRKVYVDVGSEVKEGQMLASLDAPELTSRLAGAESRWKSQEALYTASKANYERLLETSKTPGTISQNDLDQALAKMNSDRAQLESAKALYREISDARNYLEIRAPFSGVISSRNVDPGAYVGPSGKGSELPLFTLQEQKRLRLVVSVPEAFTSFFRQGDEVDFKVKARSEEVFKASIVRHAGALDTRLRSERVEMDVVNADKKLLPGMIAEVTIPMKGSDSTFVVPATAVVNSAEGVFVIRVANHKADWIYVRPGRSSNGKAEIFGPLAVGDKLVKMANEEIRNGSEIH
jgi:membrane fusion protein, multidrug efflux system